MKSAFVYTTGTYKYTRIQTCIIWHTKENWNTLEIFHLHKPSYRAPKQTPREQKELLQECIYTCIIQHSISKQKEALLVLLLILLDLDGLLDLLRVQEIGPPYSRAFWEPFQLIVLKIYMNNAKPNGVSIGPFKIIEHWP